MSLDPPLLAGLIVVVVLFNLVLALSWFAYRDHRRRQARQRRISGPVDCEKYENSVAFAVATRAIPSNAGPAEAGERKSYFELIQALQRQPEVPSSARLSRGSSQNSTDTTRLSDYVLRPQDIKELSGVPRYPKAKGRVQALRRSAMVVSPDGSALTRSNSLAETASVYSSASAPLDYHEQLFRAQPFVLERTAPRGSPAHRYPLPTAVPAAVLQPNQAPGEHRQQQSSPPSPPVQTPNAIRRPSHPDVPSTPTMSPTSTLSPLSSGARSRANSNAREIAPQVLWLQSKEQDAPRPSPALKRPSSISSLSMILSLHRVAGPSVAPESSKAIAPLNVRPRSKDAKAGLTSPPTTEPAGPSIPARSPRRPAPSA